MYSPELSEKTVRMLYRMKLVMDRPITVLAEELIKQSVRGIDKEAICRRCVAEGLQDCGNCLLGAFTNGKESDNACNRR